MKTKRLNWDSDFFELEICEINYTHKEDLADHSLLNYDLIYLYNCNNRNCKIPHFKQNFEETKVIFSKNLNTYNLISREKVSDLDSNPINPKFLYPLAYESGKYSRFKLDTNFDAYKFTEMYTKWVDNSVNKQFADQIFYINEKDKIVGFVTITKENQITKIGLIAVAPNCQGKGYGSILIQHVENYCIENKIFELHIPTQKENQLACSFYTKLGYSIIKEINIKHFWKL